MPRKKGSIKSFRQLWDAHEKLYFTIFFEALSKLQISSEQSKDEDAISEALYPILVDLCFNHQDDVRLPDWERPIPPMLNKELKGGKIRKRPDFTCSIINSFALSPEFYEIPFHIECKRLGKTVSSWNLNKNYSTNGINRFDYTSHEYGKRAPSGMIIGYLINSEPQIILEEVNNNLLQDYPKLSFIFIGKIYSCEQKLLRKNVTPENFKLIHMWTNLIDNSEKIDNA